MELFLGKIITTKGIKTKSLFHCFFIEFMFFMENIEKKSKRHRVKKIQ